MIELTRQRLSKAIQKAKKFRNFVRPVAWRVYEVITPNGDLYTVTFSVVGGRKYGKCDCEAGLNKLPCYHIASALALHLFIARMRAEQAKKEAAESQPSAEQRHEDEQRAILIKPQPESNGRIGGIEI